MTLTSLPGVSSPDLKKPHYVIIGMGYSALLNHLMLRLNPQSSRIGNLPVLHLGGPDPWTLYHASNMGQWPAVLTLPAFRTRLPNPPEHDFLAIADFTKVVTQEWRKLARLHPFFALQANVRSIRPLGKDYEIELDDESRFVAPYVDICGGPGPARRLQPTQLTDPQLTQEYADGQPRLNPWPRIVSGEMFLRASTQLPSNGSILVFGGGPTAAWCVERSEKSGCSVVWLSREGIAGALLTTRRNDSLAQHPVSRSWKNGVYAIDHDVFPANPSTVFSEGHEIDSLTKSGTQVKVRYRAYPPNSRPRRVDSSCLPCAQQHMFDQVVVALGQCKSVTEDGSWAKIIEQVFSPNIATRPHLFRDSQNRAACVQSLNGKLRLLGSSALAYPEMEEELRDSSTSSYHYFQTLPEQGRVALGIALAAVTIGEANEWFKPNPHRNLNSVTERELSRLLTLPHFSDMASSWIDPRRSRIHPWTHDELSTLQSSVADRH